MSNSIVCKKIVMIIILRVKLVFNLVHTEKQESHVPIKKIID